MPRSIFEDRDSNHPPQKEYVPPEWAYIGQTVQSNGNDTTEPVSWQKATVWNWAGNNWIKLNADLDKVDYAITDVRHDQFTIDIHDHLNYDYYTYALTVTGTGLSLSTTLPDDTNTYVVTGLRQTTTYTVNLRANLHPYPGAGQTNDNIQYVTTAQNPVPLAPINLRGESPTNSSIVLLWTTPTGSTAATHNVYIGYEGVAPALLRTGVVGNTSTVTGLAQDRKYFYHVSGVNSNGLEGPTSNQLRYATGHASVRNASTVTDAPLAPSEWGSWRPDIGWKLWYAMGSNNVSVYQGYWQGPNNTGPTPWTVPAEAHGRYRGVVTYDGAAFRRRMSASYGAGVGDNLNITRAEIKRVYRMRVPGNVDKQYMEWHLTNTNIFNSAAGPPVYDTHRNNANDADRVLLHDSIKAGTGINFLRLPRKFGASIVAGRLTATGNASPTAATGSVVNGLVLYRGDHYNNGYGTAGYGEWCGHLRYDRHIAAAPDRRSDWTLLITASWDFEIRSYVGPYPW